MKNLTLTFVVILIVLSTSIQLGAQSKQVEADISDLEMSAEMRKIILARQQQLLSNIEEGIILLNSMYGFDGGRHLQKAAQNFLYLTDLNVNNAVMLLSKDDGYSIYRPEENIYASIYYGEPLGNDILQNTYGIDQLRNITELRETVEEKIKAGKSIYIDFRDKEIHNKAIEFLNEAGGEASQIKNVNPLISEMRVIKDMHEIDRILKAIDITGQAFEDVCRNCKPGLYEFEMEALIEYNFLKYGATMPAFESIVASGENSTILHYSANNKQMEAGELLLMDVGAEYGYYAADVTRTIPVSGTFSKEQKEIYELVLESQQAAIAVMTPGNHYMTGHYAARDIIVQGLTNLGLITDSDKAWQQNFYILYPSSHYLGLDVHDVGDIRGSSSKARKKSARLGRELEHGMVLTIEPGIYFRSNGLDQLRRMYEDSKIIDEVEAFIKEVTPVYEKYKSIGVRIEDDVLISWDGNIVLSGQIPKEIKKIEELMSDK